MQLAGASTITAAAPSLPAARRLASGNSAFRKQRRRSQGIPRAWTVRDPAPDTQPQPAGPSQQLSRSPLSTAGRWCSYATLCGLANPGVAHSWPWDQQSALPGGIALPSSNFPIGLPFGVDYLLGHPFVTIGLAAGLYVVVPRLWRFFVRVILLPVLAIAAVGFALQHPAASLSFGSKAYGCAPPASVMTFANVAENCFVDSCSDVHLRDRKLLRPWGVVSQTGLCLQGCVSLPFEEAEHHLNESLRVCSRCSPPFHHKCRRARFSGHHPQPIPASAGLRCGPVCGHPLHSWPRAALCAQAPRSGDCLSS